MRDLNRRRIAKAKSHKASPRELREAKIRLKEIEEELRTVPLAPETKRGEDRERRYTRILRLRALREDFEQRFPMRMLTCEQPSALASDVRLGVRGLRLSGGNGSWRL